MAYVYCNVCADILDVTGDQPICWSCKNTTRTKDKISDPVAHPKHYVFGKIEPIDVVEDWQLGFHLGNTLKYIARAGRKGDELEDLKKARWYLDRVIALKEKT